MNILLKNTTVVCPSSVHNNKVIDILVVDGIIKRMGTALSGDANTKIINEEGMFVSAGWVDMNANSKDPGYEYKEDLTSLMNAAAAGGYTKVAVMPTTLPVASSKTEIAYIKNKSKNALVDILPVGAISRDMLGKDLSEMYDMQQAGAIAFSDAKNPVTDSGLMMRALMYAKQFNGLLFSYSDDKYISHGGKMNEGIVSTKLGLKGRPALAEELMLNRDIALLKYTEGRLHSTLISTEGSVKQVKAAKQNGLKLTSDVSAHHLFLTDEALESFDSNYKTLPPLRTLPDREALINGLIDGTIDAIVSDHTPEDVENKHKEFDMAAYGIIGLETAYAVVNTSLKNKLSNQQIVEKISDNPRKILGLAEVKIEEGELADLTVFHPAKKWIFSHNDIKSKSKNTPFVGTEFTGKVLGIINNNKTNLI